MTRRLIPAVFAASAMIATVAVQAQTPTTTTTVRPPELIKLEAQAAVEIPTPVVPAGRAPEAKKVAETSVAVKRAAWVVEHLLPPPPEGVAALKLAELKVGARGWVDLTGDVVKLADGVAIVRPALGTETVTFAVPVATDVTTLKAVTLRGEYVADRTVAFDGRDVVVLKEVTAVKPLDGAQAKVLDAARKRLEAAKAEHAQAVAVLKDTRKRAEDRVLEKTRAEAEKQIPVPKDTDVEEQVKIKAKQQELALKLAKAELEKIAMMYDDRQVVEPTGK
jgi:hypothetical protein